MNTVARAEHTGLGPLHALADTEILQAWEVGQTRHPVDRALLLLAAGCSGCAHDALADLPVGRRDDLLLTLRRLTFGPQMESRASCPECGEAVEFTVNVPALEALQDEARWPATFDLTCESVRLRARLPTSRDLAAIAGQATIDGARCNLIRRCILDARRGEAPLDAANLPEPCIETLAARILELDPLAEIGLALQCPACDHAWTVTLDIGAFLWVEIEARAQRLLRQVDTLARVYGWAEAAILSMNPLRRRAYLELATS